MFTERLKKTSYLSLKGSIASKFLVHCSKSSNMMANCHSVIIFLSFQCSFMPKFTIYIETKYADDNGCSKNVGQFLN